MFGIPGKPPVSLTPAAVAHIVKLMAKDGTEGLRVGVKKGGCAGMEYTMEYVKEINAMDEVVEIDGARVMIAPMAQMFLFGTEIDYEVSCLKLALSSATPTLWMPADAVKASSLMRPSRARPDTPLRTGLTALYWFAVSARKSRYSARLDALPQG
jgi:iron-sulfur cluster assembly protein